MSETDSEPEEAITKGEITNTAVPASSAPGPAPKPRNAFSELMKPKPKPPPPQPQTSRSHPRLFGTRDGLGAYIADPAHSPRVIYHTPSFVAIHDLYPKSTVHTLLLPRSPTHSLQHPFDAFDDPAFLAAVRAEAATLKRTVAKELQRLLGPSSAQDAAREAVLDGRVPPPQASGGLPAGRDWEAEVKVGVHAHPSMSHLHVHVMSRDMHSASMRHRKHYNSFNTPFFVGLEDFPLAAADPRRHPGVEGYLGRELVCWRCRRGFRNRFKELKEHLEVEFEAWKRE
ncbi:HIT domain-containing protein [Pleurostoma richardsiae]|uniref:Aprataxin-like protein n=1 Tax=Pleurostoma richardsiae TaxID=41990 RepID=A0AA38VM74_9PEZI|nr:HIT domain-containing protein [Pleurostoma richardsiae]